MTDVLDAELIEANRELALKMHHAVKVYRTADNPMWYFTLTHAVITDLLLENINRFERPNDLLRLNGNFANEFVKAFSGQPHNVWRIAFEVCMGAKQQSLPFGEEYCGSWMAWTHINIDLYAALQEEGCVSERDYGNMLTLVQRGVLAASVENRGPWLGEFLARRTYALVEAMRNDAYQRACKMSVPKPEPNYLPAQQSLSQTLE